MTSTQISKRKFRKVDPQIWNDAKFNSMTPCGKLSLLFLLTHPNMTSIGAMRATKIGLASELGIDPKEFDEPFAKGIAKACQEENVIWLPNFIKYNPPENPNVVTSWVKSLECLPEGDTKKTIISKIINYLKTGFQDSFSKAFTEGLGKGLSKGFNQGYSKTVSSEQ